MLICGLFVYMCPRGESRYVTEKTKHDGEKENSVFFPPQGNDEVQVTVVVVVACGEWMSESFWVSN